MMYTPGTNLSYADYLQAKTFIKDITTSNLNAGKHISMEISHQTREIIASNEALARENISVMEASNTRLASTVSDGLSELSDTISYGLQDISSGISELNGKFHWGFSQMIAGMGRMNDSLEELIKIAKTPAQTAAYEQFEIARDAFRKELYVECMEALNKAISGDHTSTGYKLEWRFHQMKGTLLLGFVGGDMTLINLAGAEDSFLLAARYAKADFPQHAGHAFLSAGWAAYCQNKLKDSLNHTEQAIAIHPSLGEAFFQASKIYMALDQIDTALPILGKAIDFDRFFALKAASDGDFRKYDKHLREFLESFRKEMYTQSVPKVKTALEKTQFCRNHFPEIENHAGVQRIKAFLSEGDHWPMMDMLAVAQETESIIKEIFEPVSQKLIVHSKKTVLGERQDVIINPAIETTEKKILVKEGGFFRNAEYRTEVTSKMVMNERTVTRSIEELRDEFYSGTGEFLTTIDFCKIPGGKFIRNADTIHYIKHLTISSDFYLGKYPVTEAQWKMIMPERHYFTGDNHPVSGVSWNDCMAFIKKLNDLIGSPFYRFPTWAELEYACRAGSSGDYCFGNDKSLLEDYAWYKANSEDKRHPVGQKKPNAWGLHDIHGSVSVWCNDWYVPDQAYSPPETDPQGPSSGEEKRSYGGSMYQSAEYCTLKRCYAYTPDKADLGCGFRLVRSI